MNANLKTLLIENLPLAVCVILAVMIVTYIVVVSFYLLRVRTVNSSHLCVLHRFQRYCASVPRNEALPVTAVERLLEAIESGNMEADIDAIVIEEIFKTQKR